MATKLDKPLRREIPIAGALESGDGALAPDDLDVLLAHLGAETLVLTGVAGNFCVLFTAHDAYMRDFHLVIPCDCMTSQTQADDRYALEHMATVTKADTRPSPEINFAELQKVLAS